MFKPSPEIRLLIVDDEEEEPHFSSREKEHFRSLRALKDPSNDSTVTAQSSKSKALIQRVPDILRENNNFTKYFEPRVVAIGPFHHRNTRLRQAEKVKLELAALFTKEHDVAEHDLYKQIKREIGDIKRCYRPKDIEDYDDEELAWMFFVDGCAVLHAIYCSTTKRKKEAERMDIKIYLLAFAQVDLFMLENQLPFRVLKLLMSSVNKGKDLRKSIDEFIDDKIKRTIAAGNSKKQQAPPEQDQEHTHLLGLLRERLLSNFNTASDKNNKSGMIGGIIKSCGPKRQHNKSKSSMIGGIIKSCGPKRQHNKTFRGIKELKEAGIHVSPTETSSLRDVHFYFGLLGALKIPRVVVDDSTGSKFMNLVAYEMCPGFQNKFEVTSYLCFLDTLIDTAQDVKELRHAGILLNYMGSDEEVADLFNKITTDLVPDLGLHKEVTEDICRYCNNPWSTLIARAYYTHFSTPWSILAFIGALLGLIFTAIQAYYSIRKGLRKN